MCVVVPFECVFLEVEVDSVLFIANRIMDAAFICDMALCFFVVPADLEEQVRENPEDRSTIRAAIIHRSSYLCWASHL